MKHILLVEDTDDLRELMRCRLESTGFNVTEAVNGNDAILEMVRAMRTFDIIVSDVQMPVMNGIELVQALRNADVTTPIIMWSDSETRDRALAFRGDVEAVYDKGQMREVIEHVRRII